MNDKKEVSYQQQMRAPAYIRYTSRFLQTLSTELASRFATRLFGTPFRFKTPKREFKMMEKSKLSKLYVSAIDKEIVVYEYGDSTKKVLLVHGWSGRGTQLCKIADMLLEMGYSTVSFDAPAHGRSTGKRTHMLEFIECVHALENVFGPFEYAIGHSLGGMTLMNAVKRGLSIEKLVIVGSGDKVTDIAEDFASRIGMNSRIAKRMKERFDRVAGMDIEKLSAYLAAREVHIPVLVIHDSNDNEVPVAAAYSILDNLSQGCLMITEGLGHRKILGDKKVIERIREFLQ